jgi:hypothetical protein
MAYKFPVENCMNCGEPLEVDENVEIAEAEGKDPTGYCPNCFVSYKMEEEE